MSTPIISAEELGIIGRSQALGDAVVTLRRVAPTDLTVLLVGESGVGKEVFARGLHRLSRRAGRRMLSINCGALPETLLESELFGHEKGAFTGAVEMRKGIFEAADGGTIFLDEIGEMTPSTQVKFLRVLERGEYTRVGSTELRSSDVRIVAATNRELVEATAHGAFRQDLYYRLNAATITIPPLRDRRDDIQLLFAFFAAQASLRLGIPFGGIAPEAMEILIDYPWPGNIRELKNFTELIITLEQEEQITARTVLEHLDVARFRPPSNPGALVHLVGRTPEQAERELIYRALIDLRNEVGDLKAMMTSRMHEEREPAVTPYALPPSPVAERRELLEKLEGKSLEEVERMMILGALDRYGDNRRRAADALGISERTLYRKIHLYRDGEGEEEEQGETEE